MPPPTRLNRAMTPAAHRTTRARRRLFVAGSFARVEICLMTFLSHSSSRAEHGKCAGHPQRLRERPGQPVSSWLQTVVGEHLGCVKDLLQHFEQLESPGELPRRLGGFGPYVSVEPTLRGPGDLECESFRPWRRSRVHCPQSTPEGGWCPQGAALGFTLGFAKSLALRPSTDQARRSGQAKRAVSSFREEMSSLM